MTAKRPSHESVMNLQGESSGLDDLYASPRMRMEVRGSSGAFLPGRDRAREDKAGRWRPVRDLIFAVQAGLPASARCSNQSSQTDYRMTVELGNLESGSWGADRVTGAS